MLKTDRRIKNAVAPALFIVMLCVVQTITVAAAEPVLLKPSILHSEYERIGESPEATVVIKAYLKDVDGNPISDAVVRFEMETMFKSTLKFGLFPTDERGEATLVLRDRRYGVYPIHIFFKGDDTYASSENILDVDFSARSAPSLPKEGILIQPYPTFVSTFPFLVFYGTCWVVFVYALGWLVLWKMRREQ